MVLRSHIHDQLAIPLQTIFSQPLSLLAAFLSAPQRVLSRDELLDLSRVHDNEVFDRTLDVQILRLRRKIEVNPGEPELIKTERGVGYMFAAKVDVL